MKNGIVKFYLIKLILIALVSVCAALAAYLIGTVVNPFDGALYHIIVSGVPTVFFMYFMYTVESRIKIPDGDALTAGYFLRFSLREASIYTLFLIIPTAVRLIAPSALTDGIVGYFFAPHTLFLRLTDSAAVNIIALTAVFGCVAFAAHYIKYRRTASSDDNVGDGE